jgi:hypothetical protein
MLVFVEVLLDRTTLNVFDQFKAAVQVHPEIMECHLVAGGFDYLLKTRAADMNAYRVFAGNVLWQLPGVRETRTYAVMEEVKHSTICICMCEAGRCPMGVEPPRAPPHNAATNFELIPEERNMPALPHVAAVAALAAALFSQWRLLPATKSMRPIR